MENLNLANNKITYLDSNIFENLKQLKTLNLSYNSLKTINFLNGLDSLHHLKLKSNEIANINVNSLKNLFQLSCLIVSYNKIDFIEDNSFNTLTNLEKLDLKINRLVCLTANTFNG